MMEHMWWACNWFWLFPYGDWQLRQLDNVYDIEPGHPA